MASIFQKNEGAVDRVVRIIIGAGVLSLVWIGPQTAWGWIGLIPLITGIAGTCPAYSIFGMSTCRVDKEPAAKD